VRARDLIALAVLVTPIAVPLALAKSSAPGLRKSVDFETAFAAGFPAHGKGSQTQQVEASIKSDARLRAAFDEQRRRTRTMVLYSDGDASGTCRRSLMYVGKEFRLVLGARAAGADALASATVAPSCVESAAVRLAITAGRSPRFKCWSIDGNGNRVADAEASDVTTPLELGLEFVAWASSNRREWACFRASLPATWPRFFRSTRVSRSRSRSSTLTDETSRATCES
jgi:hypothetical protein